ncbi:MBL fold metallo-hydrolase [Bacillota bacterium LX-D]|nr:MBL fold metallo-hydrolase [Bacillota bacterium LX-D]
MFFKSIKVGPIATNCYILGCQVTKEAAVIDPGFDSDVILQCIDEEDLHVKYIINTHGHADHVGANAEIKKVTGAEILIYEDDRSFLLDPSKNLSIYMGMEITGPPADKILQEGDIINIGKTINLEVLHTPGHTPGGISLKGDTFIMTGDTLFAGSIGRTDLPGGSYESLLEGIKNKLLPLKEDYIIYPGHGQSTTLQKERTSNQFIFDLL